MWMKPEIIWTLGALYLSHYREVTEVDHSVVSVEIDTKISHLQHAALWKWWGTPASSCDFFPFCHCYLGPKGPFPFDLSFLFQTGCYPMSNSSQMEFKIPLTWALFQTCWIRSQGRDICVCNNVFPAFLCQPVLKTTVILPRLDLLSVILELKPTQTTLTEKRNLPQGSKRLLQNPRVWGLSSLRERPEPGPTALTRTSS